MKFILSLVLLVCAWDYIAFAQAPAAAPSPSAAIAAPAVSAAPAVAPVPPPIVVPVPVGEAPVVVSSSGLMGWINAHGGFPAVILLLVGSAFSLLSSIRMILFKFEGIDPNGNVPAGGLSTLNQICIILGKVVDFLTGNVAH